MGKGGVVAEHPLRKVSSATLRKLSSGISKGTSTVSHLSTDENAPGAAKLSTIDDPDLQLFPGCRLYHCTRGASMLVTKDSANAKPFKVRFETPSEERVYNSRSLRVRYM